ncbi:hypothetical protein ACJX0J_034216 [Zea mays]
MYRYILLFTLLIYQILNSNSSHVNIKIENSLQPGGLKILAISFNPLLTDIVWQKNKTRVYQGLADASLCLSELPRDQNFDEEILTPWITFIFDSKKNYILQENRTQEIRTYQANHSYQVTEEFGIYSCRLDVVYILLDILIFRNHVPPKQAKLYLEYICTLGTRHMLYFYVELEDENIHHLPTSFVFARNFCTT